MPKAHRREECRDFWDGVDSTVEGAVALLAHMRHGAQAMQTRIVVF